MLRDAQGELFLPMPVEHYDGRHNHCARGRGGRCAGSRHRSNLPGSERLSVDLLSSNLMDQLIWTRGVHGVHARRVVLSQAEGQPGWAMLCDAQISRDGVRVLSGEVLLEHAMRCGVGFANRP